MHETRLKAAGDDTTLQVNSERDLALRRMEAEFARVLRAAVTAEKFGQFGVIVSLQHGHVKTYQTHAVETLK